MKIYTLKKTIGTKTTEQKLSAGKPIQIQAQQDAQYELVDENGNLLQPLKEKDTLKWLNPENEEIIVQIEHYQPSELAPILESHSIAPETIQVKSAVLASEVSVGKAVLWGIGGLLTAGGIALATLGRKGGNGSHSQNKTTADNSNKEAPTSLESSTMSATSKEEERPNPPTTDESLATTTPEETPNSNEPNETATNQGEEKEPAATENNATPLPSEEEERPNPPTTDASLAPTTPEETPNSNESDEATTNQGEEKEPAATENNATTAPSEEERPNPPTTDESLATTTPEETPNSNESAETATNRGEKEEPIATENSATPPPSEEEERPNPPTTDESLATTTPEETPNSNESAETATNQSEKEEPVATENTAESTSSGTEEMENSSVDQPPTNVEESPSPIETKETTTDNSTEEPAPIEIPTPIIHFDPITEDNIINLAESQSAVRISGRVEHANEGDTVHFRIGEAQYTAKLEQGKFSVNVDGQTLANHHSISATIQTHNQEGNATATGTAQKAYEVDILAPQPTLVLDDITDDNVINRTEAAGKIQISGVTTEVADGAKVVVACGCPSCLARLGVEALEKTAVVTSGRFSVEFDGSDLVADGRHIITARVLVQDKAGNVASAETAKEYQVKLSTSDASWQWHSVTEDNAINAQEAQQAVRVSGEIANLAENETALVMFKVAGKQFFAVKNGNEYYADIPASALVENTSMIKATVTITDTAGNQTIKEISHQYQYDTQINAPQITDAQINNGMPISQKNALEGITVSGRVQYDSDVAEKDVQIWVELNGERFNATLNQQQWTVSIPGQKFTAETEIKTLTISANIQDQVGNQSSSTIKSEYQLELAPEKITNETLLTEEAELPSTPVQLYLDPISATDMEHQQYIGVSGKLVLNGDFLEGKNKSRVYAVYLDVDGKSYQGIVDRSHQTFTLKIPTADVAHINNKDISYRFDTAQTIYTLTPDSARANHFQINTVLMPKLDKNNVVFDNNSLFNQGKFALPEQQNTVTITGRAEGQAQSGNTVTIRIGEKSFNTTLNEELKFSLTVNKSEISAGEKIVASLAEQQAEAIFSQAPKLNDTFVSHHFFDSSFQTVAPYFLKSQAYQSWANPPTLFHGNSAPFNLDKKALLTYNFFKSDRTIQFKDEDKQAVKKSLEIISKYANIEFQEASADQHPDINYFMQPLQNRYLGFADFGGNVYLAASLRQYGHLLNQKATQTILHETLHSLGSKHPFEGEHRLPSVENKRSITVMSYFHDTEVEDLGIFDLVFLHYRFGVNRNQRTGDDTYGFKPVNTKTADHDIYIWDGAGVDTFDASDQAQGVNVNLTPGSWIYSGKKSQNFIIDPNNKYSNNEYFDKPDNVRFQGAVDVYSEKYLHTQGQAFIGFGTQIERLIGSSYDDVLTGNKANNHIYGGKGDDVINGGEGNDYLDGGSGKNTLSGNLGDDIYVVNSQEDKVIEKLNEGTDRVDSYIDYTLPEHVENLALFGSGNLSATGNHFNNVLIGNNNDNRLEGKEGADRLTGGKGKDTFVFSTELNDNNIDTITDFTVGEDKIELSKAIFSEIDSTEEIIEHIRYEKETGKLFYHQDNITSEGTHFATINDNLLLNVQSFILV